MRVEVVENPTRRKRRRLSAKQKAAGFGGKRSMRRRRRTRRRRNPKGFLGFKGFDLRLAAMVGIGITSAEIVPNIVRKFWSGVPTAGPMGYVVKAGSAVVAAYGVKMVTGKQADFEAVIAGGFGSLLVGAFKEYVMPMVPGLNGLAGNGVYVYPDQLTDVTSGVGRYIDNRGGSRLGRYVDIPDGAY